MRKILTILILGSWFFVASPVMAQEGMESGEVMLLSQNQFEAVAGEDRNVVVGRQVLFSGSASLVPEDVLTNYVWDFGDGTTARGVDVVHVYSKPGIYRATLTLFAGDEEVTDEVIVSVDKDIVLLITDSKIDEKVWRSLQNIASTQGTLLVNIQADDSSVEYIQISNLTQEIIGAKEDIRQASSLIILTDDNVGLNALLSASQEFVKGTDLDGLGFKNKSIVVLTEENLSVTSRLGQNIFQLLSPKKMLLSKPEARELVVGNFDISSLMQELQTKNIDCQLIGIHTQRLLIKLRPWNFLSYMVNSMVNQGVATNTIYLILILPVISMVIAFVRQLIGIKAFGIYAPSLVAVSFLATGIKYGLIIFVIVLIVGTLARLLARKIKIMYLPRMSIVLSIVSLSILVLFFFGALIQQSALISISVFPILIMVIMAEKFISAQIEFGHKKAWQLFVETLILSILCYYLATWESLRSLILGYPEIIFITFLLNYLLGRWTGLRLLELYRFRNVIKNVEFSEKK